MTWGDVEAPITAMGSAAVATLAFRVGGELRVAVVVKGTFILAPDGPMVRTDPDPIVRGDQLRDKSPASSLVAGSDLVPYRPRADVLLSGHARAPRDIPTRAMGVRLMVARGQEVVLDKRLAVRGTPDPASATREPLPFAAMLLAWELAAGSPDNPVGIREAAHAWAHIVDPRQRDRPAGFGPISPRWPARRSLVMADLVERGFAAPIPEVPREFPWAYFNAAPEDQRLDFFRGDEWIGFEGMNSQLPRVQSCLPGVRALARVYGPTPQLLTGQPLPLEADTLVVDTDRLRCSVVWRGSFPVPGGRDGDVGALHVFAGIATAAEPLSFPSSYTGPAARPRTSPGLAPVRAAPPGTTDDPTTTTDLPPLRPATPFQAPPAEPPPRPRTTTRNEEPHAETAIFSFSPPPEGAAATPFAPIALPPRPPGQRLPAATPFERANLVAPPPADSGEGTVDLESLVLTGSAAVPVARARGPASGAGSTMDVSALMASIGLPFSAPTPPSAQPAPAPDSVRAPKPVNLNATMAVGALFPGQALPFSAGAGGAPGAPAPPEAQRRFDGGAKLPAGTKFPGFPGGDALPFSGRPRPPSQPPPSGPGARAAPPAPRPADLGATMDGGAGGGGAMLPFAGATPGAAPPAPRSVPPPPPSAGSTMDLSKVLEGQVLPFQPAAPPQTFGQASVAPPQPAYAPPPPVQPVAPVSVAPQGPLFPEVARPAPSALPSTPAGAAPPPPSMLDVAAVSPAVPEAAGGADAPKTLGEFFLAAMARAAKSGAPSASVAAR